MSSAEADSLVAQRIADDAWPGGAVEPLLVSENATFRVRGASEHQAAVDPAEYVDPAMWI